ncbi:MAG: LemA family protein [bacterium]
MPLFLVVIAVVLVIFISIYNSFVNSKNRVEESFSSIDVMLKKRYDLIPNLVESVKQYMGHENSVLTEVTKLRKQALEGDLSAEEQVKLNSQLDAKLKTLNVAVESYPELKANEGFNNLQRSLNEVEEQLSAARRTYNANVKEYNVKVEAFPSNIIASMMNYQKKAFFEVIEQERENVSVKNSFN